ncbi:ABC transporter ATP-binding protein [Telmatospirillum siberiense]|uniref:ABC transporter n=1 Tax=Telmatospirillum siberiense TaxID=382514 RepID=A0A2N3PSU6_9PROT|nr:ABC transporter ATP-binding protein [Telmatospirillum siberiense]PKU23467.1 ABC transporter [Telmatospirillum siberiense]
MTKATPDGQPIILLDDVTLKLASQAGEVNILRGIDLAVREGETIGVVGPSGSGKSTMMMVIAGLERPTSGRVVVAGHDLTRLDENGLATFRRENVGIIFQAFHLIPTMTALENVAIPMELARRPDAREEARRLLGLVGLSERLSHYPGQLSGGEQQRVALARAFGGRPRLLLADEPTGNLDQVNGQAVIDLLFGLHRETGTTLLLITHDPGLAAQCQRVVRIADGRVEAVTATPARAGGR